MIEAGALDEVAALVERGLDTALPAMRAHGVPELSAVLRQDTSLEEACDAAVLATGRYTRRQATWFRHHTLGKKEDSMDLLRRYPSFEQDSENYKEKIQNFISKRVDLRGVAS
ncbi:tRNA isopentenyltransferase [Neokomagataea thailandica NBRC 106555]|nr:tRNA isopentenyltransferase [Neokomagataea thailandica NBRC 106555]